MGDVLHATGVNLHAAGALFWTLDANVGGGRAADAANAFVDTFVDTNAKYSSCPPPSPSSETPALAASAEARLVDAADAVRDDGRVDTYTFAVPVAPNRAVAELRPAAGSASGGTLVSLSPSREGLKTLESLQLVAASACWFGTVGPVRGGAFEKDSGAVACASPAGAPSRRGVSTRHGARAPALSETHVGRAGLEGDGASHVFLRDGDPAVPAALLGAVVVAPDGGETTAWVPAWDSRGGSAMRHDGERVRASARALDAVPLGVARVGSERVPGVGDARAGRRRVPRARRARAPPRTTARRGCLRTSRARARARSFVRWWARRRR